MCCVPAWTHSSFLNAATDFKNYCCNLSWTLDLTTGKAFKYIYIFFIIRKSRKDSLIFFDSNFCQLTNQCVLLSLLTDQRFKLNFVTDTNKNIFTNLVRNIFFCCCCLLIVCTRKQIHFSRRWNKLHANYQPKSEKVRIQTYLGLGYHQTLFLKLTQVLAVNIA